ncbi:two-component system sensor histidine kinase NtrB [Psychrobacter sp. I-STPA10]|uniref:two-component system sensor histidine kinase NtrB n=1 Tax=Psychrobacter sp. I-STPA10 TaxID=2585769 RepID=UPI001E647312|nr:ATP-binding protein [Psychrobacter sp. I-STPA10]
MSTPQQPKLKQTQADNIKNINHISHMMQHLFTAVLWVDADLQICWVNAQAEQLFACSRSRLLGQCILALLTPIIDVQTMGKKTEQANTKNMSATLTTSDMHNDMPLTEQVRQYIHETVQQNPELDEESVTILAQQFSHALNYQQAFIDYNQTIIGITKNLLVDYSVTPVEYNKARYYLIELWGKNRHIRIDQEQRQQEQHDMAKQMLRSVAHEVKNPLAGIRGGAQLLNKYFSNLPERITPSDHKKMRTYADIVISETDRLSHLIEQLLGSNRLPHWQSINIHEPLEHVLMLTQTQHPQVQIQRDYDLSLPEIMADKDQLIQVFLNLTNNACNAMLEQVSTADYQLQLTITTRIEFQHTIGTTAHKKVVKICIHDNGGGIAPEIIDRIFFPLVTGRAHGTGLGLSLVQDMVHCHHGSIDVSSQVGDTTFSIYLPLQQTL